MWCARKGGLGWVGLVDEMCNEEGTLSKSLCCCCGQFASLCV